MRMSGQANNRATLRRDLRTALIMLATTMIVISGLIGSLSADDFTEKGFPEIIDDFAGFQSDTYKRWLRKYLEAIDLGRARMFNVSCDGKNWQMVETM